MTTFATGLPDDVGAGDEVQLTAKARTSKGTIPPPHRIFDIEEVLL
jgi:hypothetical protein